MAVLSLPDRKYFSGSFQGLYSPNSEKVLEKGRPKYYLLTFVSVCKDAHIPNFPEISFLLTI